MEVSERFWTAGRFVIVQALGGGFSDSQLSRNFAPACATVAEIPDLFDGGMAARASALLISPNLPVTQSGCAHQSILHCGICRFKFLQVVLLGLFFLPLNVAPSAQLPDLFARGAVQRLKNVYPEADVKVLIDP